MTASTQTQPPPPPRKFVPCRECNGTGRLPVQWAFAGYCLTCNHTGQVEVKP